MSEERNSRTAALIGEKGVALLSKKRVAVVGLGGVGGYAVEALARAGVGALLLVDGDTVVESNLNRQLFATASTVGMRKGEAAKARINDVAPECRLEVRNVFFHGETAEEFSLLQCDYVIDAIDSVKDKLDLLEYCLKKEIPVISAMGAGNKRNPEKFKVADISKTHTCPLARVVRTEMKKRGFSHFKTVFSDELPTVKERTPASISFVPGIAGLMLAAEVINDLLEE